MIGCHTTYRTRFSGRRYGGFSHFLSPTFRRFRLSLALRASSVTLEYGSDYFSGLERERCTYLRMLKLLRVNARLSKSGVRVPDLNRNRLRKSEVLRTRPLGKFSSLNIQSLAPAEIDCRFQPYRNPICNWAWDSISQRQIQARIAEMPTRCSRLRTNGMAIKSCLW